MFIRSFISFSRLLVVATALTLSTGAKATSGDNERVLERLVALEARIASLETENRAIKREAAEARVQARNAVDQRVRSANAAIPNSSVAYSVAAEHPTIGWTGVYWGGSAGGAATRSNVLSSERDVSASPFSTPPFNVNGSDILGSSRGRQAGGMLDLIAGWNSQLSNFVIGAQLEATSAALDFSGAGPKAYAFFNANGPTDQSSVGEFRPQITARWMTSALLRAGVLLNDQTLLYGIGGWTGAQFEARNVTENPFFQPSETFWANGWTAGAGIERRLDSNWSVRAEYRYTDFGTVRVNDQFLYTSSFLGSTSSQTADRRTQYDLSMQSGRIGIAYAFNPLR